MSNLSADAFPGTGNEGTPVLEVNLMNDRIEFHGAGEEEIEFSCSGPFFDNRCG